MIYQVLTPHMSSTPDLRLRPEPEMGARRLISSTGSKRLTGARRVEDVGKQTRSEPVETAFPGKSRSDSSLNATYMSKVITLRYELQI